MDSSRLVVENETGKAQRVVLRLRGEMPATPDSLTVARQVATASPARRA